MPCRAAWVSPDTYVTGVEITSGQGQAATRVTKPVLAHTRPTVGPSRIHGNVHRSTLPWALYGPTVGRVWAKMGLVTLVAACPCPLVISTPVTYVSGLTHAARHGIIVKGGAILEVHFLLERIHAAVVCRRLSIDNLPPISSLYIPLSHSHWGKVQIIAMDKTGTLRRRILTAKF